MGQNTAGGNVMTPKEKLDNLIADTPSLIEALCLAALELSGKERWNQIVEIADLVSSCDNIRATYYTGVVLESKIIGKRDFTNLIKQAKSQNDSEAEKKEKEAYKSTLLPDDLLRFEIDEVRRSGQYPFEIRKAISHIVIDDMKTTGRFYVTPFSQTYWFDSTNKELYGLDGEEIRLFINQRYEVNPSESEFAFLKENLLSEVYYNGTESDVHRFSYYDKSDKILYVDNNANQVYRIDGSDIELRDNGEDGVLFLRNDISDPFSYLPASNGKYIDDIVIDQIKFSTYSPLSIHAQKKLLRIWMQTLFFESALPAKPIQAFIGDFGSGKSTAQKMIGRWLIGKRFNVNSVTVDKQDDFDVAIINEHFVGIDNVDSNVPWLFERLSTAATGENITRRKLYTTNTSMIFPVKCFISVSSRSPHFTKEDLTDRMIIFNLGKITDKKAESSMFDSIAENRDNLWTEMLNGLNSTVNRIKNDESERPESSFRMADWADLGWSVSKTMDWSDPFIESLSKIVQSQEDLTTEDDAIFDLLEILVSNIQSGEMAKLVEIDAKQLHTMLMEYADWNKIELTLKARGFAKIFRQRLSVYQKTFNIEATKKKNRWLYTIDTFGGDTEPTTGSVEPEQQEYVF